MRFSLPASLSCASMAVLLAALTGCSWTDKSETRHILIVGVGIVSVNNSKPEAATVTRTHVLGATISSQRGADLEIGYSSVFVTSVPDGAEDVRIEASKQPFAPIKIEVHKSQLSQTNHINKGVK